MRGIEPIIAVVILVAVTLVIAIGVIGWIMGWWGTMGAVESLQIFPDSYIKSTDRQLVLHIKNTGSATAVIYKVEIVGVGTADLGGADKSLAAGQEETAWTLQFSGDVTAGTNYQVKIYTKAGNVYSANVKAV
jgi:flagellin-like protein